MTRFASHASLILVMTSALCLACNNTNIRSAPGDGDMAVNPSPSRKPWRLTRAATPPSGCAQSTAKPPSRPS
jgi:hypothetical protein